MINGRLLKWDRRYLELAKHVSNWSKDNSTRVGAVIATADFRPVSFGFNGLPQGVDDDPVRYADRDLKLQLIVHAEVNALVFAGDRARGSTLYTWPFMPCCRCAGLIIQHGIKRVVAPVTPPDLAERWEEELALTKLLFSEAKVELKLMRDP